jgi:hypothetical protein
MQKIATVQEDAVFIHGHVSRDLLHPRFVRVNGDPGNVHPAALKMDEEKHVVGHQPAEGQSRSRNSAQDDKWSFCLRAGTLCPANQEKS